ncbi:MAG: NosD domain-containing protein [Candidatus Thorarchaeota archaeon]|jgi:parallel beta-helix repeat protein
MPQGRIACILIVFLICFTGYQLALNSGNQDAGKWTSLSISITLNELQPNYFTEHSPIIIDSNQDFEEISSGGTGVEENPYIIEKLHIVATGSQNSSISVEYTSAHFIIRDCYLESDWAGIEIRHLTRETASIVNNTCISNSGTGAGIVVWGTINCTIVGNRCSNLAQGIHLNEASRCNISSNNITDNNYQGINIRYSHYNTIIGNMVVNTSEHGVALVGTSSYNVIHHNQFVDNGRETTYRIDGELRGELTSQGFDEGRNNTWYDATTEEGNWWSDYSGSGTYIIDGPSDSADQYPIAGESQQQSPGLDMFQVTVVLLFGGGLMVLLAWWFLRPEKVKT